MIEKYISGIVFSIIGIVIIIANLFIAKNIAAFVIGGLFLGAGIMCLVQDFINKNKKDN